MASFRRYGGLNFTATNNGIRSTATNVNSNLNVNQNYVPINGNVTEIISNDINMAGNNISNTRKIEFLDGTFLSL